LATYILEKRDLINKMKHQDEETKENTFKLDYDMLLGLLPKTQQRKKKLFNLSKSSDS